MGSKLSTNTETEWELVDAIDDAEDVSNEDTSDEYSDDDEEEYDEEEMKLILAETKRLRFMADAFLHPEKPVPRTGLCLCDGCYYDRPSAPARLGKEEADEAAQIVSDAASLGRLAHDYAHPEEPCVTSDPAATARSYYDRYSAEPQLTVEEAEEQARIIIDIEALRKAARDYLHPEVGVTHTDPVCFGRNYYARSTAPEQLSYEDAEEQAHILADAKALKERAVMYFHPELPVVTSDPTSVARCYFHRASAPMQLSYEEAEEQSRILANAAALKKLAVDYGHPELPVVTSDPSACARCSFDRASAPCCLEQIVSTSAYAIEKKEEQTLEKRMETLEALAPATKTKVTPVIGPHAGSPAQSASNVHLFDLEFA